MPISRDKIIQAAVRYIDDGAENPDSRAGVMFTELLVELACQLKYDMREIEKFINPSIAQATRRSQRIIAKVADGLRMVSTAGMRMPSTEALQSNEYLNLFVDDILRIKQFALDRIACTMQLNAKDKFISKPRF